MRDKNWRFGLEDYIPSMKIEDDQIIDALGRSGYFLESRVLQILADKGYKNFPNETYPDPHTDKSREIDIYAESQRITENIELNHHLHFEYQFRIVIECINNAQPVAFFKRPDKEPRTIFGKFFYSKVERELKESGHSEFEPSHQFDDYTTRSKHFHYNQTNRYTQYCSFSQKKGGNKEWMASHPDALHDTFNKLFSYSERKNETIKAWLPWSPWRNDVVTILIFPLVVLQNDLMEVSQSNEDVNIRRVDHAVFDFKTTSESMDGLLIDVVTEEYLSTYLGLVEGGVKELKNRIVKTYLQGEIAKIDPSKTI